MAKWFLILLYTYAIVLAGHILIGYSFVLGFQLSDFVLLPVIALTGFLLVRKTYNQLSTAVFAQSVRIWLCWFSLFTTLATVAAFLYVAQYSDNGFFHWQSEASFGGSAHTLYIDRFVGVIALLSTLCALGFTSLIHRHYSDLAIISVVPPILLIIFQMYLMYHNPGDTSAYPSYG